MKFLSAPTDQCNRHHHDDGKKTQEIRSNIRLTKSVHTVQYSRTCEKRAEDCETECGNKQGQVPYPQHAATLLNQYGVNVRSTGEPWNERSILNRIPCPHAAPTQHFITPPGTKNDAKRQEAPREQCPTARLDKPTFADATSNQCTNCKSKWHCHTDISEIQNWRVKHHKNVVLQQWVWPWSIKHSWCTSCKRIRWTQSQDKEKDADKKHGGNSPAHHGICDAVAVLKDDATC